MPNPTVSRRQIVRACKQKGWTIQPGPLAALERVLQQDEHLTPSDFLHTFVEPHMRNSSSSSQRTITSDVWEAVLNSSSRSSNDHTTTNDDHLELTTTTTHHNHNKNAKKAAPTTDPDDNGSLRIVSAFHQPRLVYNTMRQQFRVDEKEWSLFGTAEEKVDMLAQRYALIHQRILRHKMFRPTSLTHLYNPQNDKNSNNDVQFHITPMERLLGQRHQTTAAQHRSKSILVLGLLREMDDRYYLEDPTGLVPISLLEQVEMSDPDLVLAEDSIYLVEGTWHDGTLIVLRMGPPLLESRRDSLQAIHQQIQHPMFGNTATSSSLRKNHPGENTESPIVILSDVHLDQPQVVQHLEGILAQYEGDCSSSPNATPPLFCLMGNFSSVPLSSRTSLQSLLQDELAATIRKYPYLSQHAHFVLVPGPHDVPPSAVLPWALPTHTPFPGVRHMVASTNPTRLYWQDTEMVLFRSLPQQLWDHGAGGSMSLPTSASQKPVLSSQDSMEDDDEPQSSSSALRLIKTMLDQGHLVPGAGGGVSPIYWNYDHSLRLYPLPTSLVVGMDNAAMDEGYEGCRIVAPGSLSRNGQYAIYQAKSPEDAMLEDDHDNGLSDGVKVELLQLDPIADR